MKPRPTVLCGSDRSGLATTRDEHRRCGKVRVTTANADDCRNALAGRSAQADVAEEVCPAAVSEERAVHAASHAQMAWFGYQVRDRNAYASQRLRPPSMASTCPVT